MGALVSIHVPDAALPIAEALREVGAGAVQLAAAAAHGADPSARRAHSPIIAFTSVAFLAQGRIGSSCSTSPRNW